MWTVTVSMFRGSFMSGWRDSDRSLGAKKMLARIIVIPRKAVQKLFGDVYIRLRIKKST